MKFFQVVRQELRADGSRVPVGPSYCVQASSCEAVDEAFPYDPSSKDGFTWLVTPLSVLTLGEAFRDATSRGLSVGTLWVPSPHSDPDFNPPKEENPEPSGPHPSHKTRISMDASTYDEICTLCGATDEVPGGWGELAKPCPCAIKEEVSTPAEKPGTVQQVPGERTS